MPIFRYEAVDKTGKTVRGAMDAPSEQAVAQKLNTMGYRAQTILRPGASSSVPKASDSKQRTSSADRSRRSSSGIPVSVEPSVPLRDLAFFYRQLAAYVRSGQSPYQAFTDVQGMTRNRKIRNAVAAMAERVRSGESISTAMAEYPHIFPVYATAQVWNGELGGYVDKAMEEVAASLEEDLKDQRWGRFGWIIFKISLISFILTIPALDMKSIFLNAVGSMSQNKDIKVPNVDLTSGDIDPSQLLGTSKPDITEVIIAVLKGYLDTVLRVYLPIIIALFIFWWLWTKVKRMPKVRRVLDSMILCVPLWGSIQREKGRARFARSLAALQKAAIDPATAWDAASLTVRNSVMAEQLRACSPMLRQNATLQDAFNRCGIYAYESVNMIGAGEKTGQVADMAEKLASYHDSRISGLRGMARFWAVHGLIWLLIAMAGFTLIYTAVAWMDMYELMLKMLGIEF